MFALKLLFDREGPAGMARAQVCLDGYQLARNEMPAVTIECDAFGMLDQELKELEKQIQKARTSAKRAFSLK